MLLVVDMQNDFIDKKRGKMPVRDGDRLVDGIRNKVKEYEEKKDLIFYTINIHHTMPNDSRSLANKKWGQSLCDGLKDLLLGHIKIHKCNYGIQPRDLDHALNNIDKKYVENIELVGVETHICVLSNAIILQNIFHDSRILIDGKLCTSNDLLLHNKALDIMEALQMEVKR